MLKGEWKASEEVKAHFHVTWKHNPQLQLTSASYPMYVIQSRVSQLTPYGMACLPLVIPFDLGDLTALAFLT